MQLLRPLHRRRHRRRHRTIILDGEELSLKYGVQLDALEAYLLANQLPYHKDSQGAIWASVTEPTDHKA
jgi:hypothetical protein